MVLLFFLFFDKKVAHDTLKDHSYAAELYVCMIIFNNEYWISSWLFEDLHCRGVHVYHHVQQYTLDYFTVGSFHACTNEYTPA